MFHVGASRLSSWSQLWTASGRDLSSPPAGREIPAVGVGRWAAIQVVDLGFLPAVEEVRLATLLLLVVRGPVVGESQIDALKAAPCAHAVAPEVLRAPPVESQAVTCGVGVLVGAHEYEGPAFLLLRLDELEQGLPGPGTAGVLVTVGEHHDDLVLGGSEAGKAFLG